jgi:type II secretory pathway component PulK
MTGTIRHRWSKGCARAARAWKRLRGERGPRRAPLARRRRAVILVLVLWIAVVLSMLAYSVLYQMSLELRLTSMSKKTLQAKAMARAGMAKGFVDLRNDMIFDFSDDTIPPFDALGDVWADPSENKEDVELGPGSYTVSIVDEESLLDINQFRAANRIVLEKIIERIGYEEEDAKIVASAIIDYADPDDQPVLELSQGVEGFAYGVYVAEALGQSTREDDVERLVFPNEPYLTVDALLDVYGVTPELFFGPDSPEAAYYRELAGEVKGDRFEMSNRARRATRRKETQFGLRDYFTVHGTGRLNVNTAPQHVLAAVFDAAGASDPDRLAEQIVKFRPGGTSRRRVNNDNAFKSTADMQQNADLASIYGPAQALYRFEVRSSVFTLTSVGTVGDVSQTLKCTVTRGLAQLQRDESFEAIDRAREREERYEDRRQRHQDKENELLVRQPNIRILQWGGP